MTSPLNVISTKCVTTSCGTNDARKRWLPSALTKLVTCPPFTRISKFPEPALDPSTDEQNGFHVNESCDLRETRKVKYIRTLELHRLVHHPVRDLADLYSSSIVRLRSEINNSPVNAIHPFPSVIYADRKGTKYKKFLLKIVHEFLNAIL